MFAECIAVGLACGDIRRLTGNGSALEALGDDAVYKSTYLLCFYLFYQTVLVDGPTEGSTCVASRNSTCLGRVTNRRDAGRRRDRSCGEIAYVRIDQNEFTNAPIISSGRVILMIRAVQKKLSTAARVFEYLIEYSTDTGSSY